MKSIIRDLSLKGKILLIVFSNILICSIAFMILGEWSLQQRSNVASASNSTLFNNVRLEKEKNLEQDISREIGILVFLVKRFGREQIKELAFLKDSGMTADGMQISTNLSAIYSVFNNLADNYNISYLTVISDDYKVLWASKSDREIPLPASDFETTVMEKLCAKADSSKNSVSSMITINRYLRFIVVHPVFDTNDQIIAYISMMTHPIHLAKKFASSLDAIVGYEDMAGNFTFTVDSLQLTADIHKKMKKAAAGSNSTIKYHDMVYMGIVSNITDVQNMVCGRVWIMKDYTTGNHVERRIIIIQMILLAAITCICILIIYMLSITITKPIGNLVKSTNLIVQGDYSFSVAVDSNDEIGNLAGHFEKMRLTVKQYTEHLQEIIDEKMQQVNDILNNIDQGLMTLNFDGTINKEYSARANTILRVPDVASCTIGTLLRLDTQQEQAFHAWLRLVQRRYSQLRWQKLVHLAPIHTITLPGSSDTVQDIYISTMYQAIYDKTNTIKKVMLLVHDETERKNKDKQIVQQRREHEYEVKAILGIANTPPEEMNEFMEDTMARMQKTKNLIAARKESHNTKIGTDETKGALQTADWLDEVFRHMHTIKGNGASYGFEELSHCAHIAEELLDAARTASIPMGNDFYIQFNALFSTMHMLLNKIRNTSMKIHGDQFAFMVSVRRETISRIQNLCRSISQQYPSGNIEALIDECAKLSWKPLKVLTRKYLKTVISAARKLHKDINFIVCNDNALYPEDLFSDLDEIIVHLLRNAVDHGIESNEVREEMRKGAGCVTLSIAVDQSYKTLTISDDGYGIDTVKLVERCIEQKLITPAEAAALTEKEQLELIYMNYISTASGVSELSGRGTGMTIIRKKVIDMEGTISVESTTGSGTSFIVTIPIKKHVPVS